MRRKLNGKQILTAVIVIVTILATNAVQYFIWNKSMSDTVSSYEGQISTLKSTIANVGELVNIYTVGSTTFPGKQVTQEDLVPIEIPASFVKDSYVLDPGSVVGKFYKIEVEAGTPLTSDLIMSEELDDTSREVDIVANTWPVGLKEGDYVDFEITYPMGEKYVVLSHKRVTSINQTAVKMTLNGTERHLYSGVLVDYFLQQKAGATINLVKYTEPGAQKPAQVYYAVPDNILSIILMDPNVVSKVDAAINAQRRAMIESGLELITDTDGSAIASGRAEIQAKMTGAANTAAQQDKEDAEKAAQEALEAAGAQPDPNAGYTPPASTTDTSGASSTPSTSQPNGAMNSDGLEVKEGVVN